MPRTVAGIAIENNNELSSMQKRRNSTIVTIIGEEHNASGSTVYFSLSPDLVIISELKFKIIASEAFTNVVLDGSTSLGWNGTAGVSPDRGPNNFFDLLNSLSGTSAASSFFDGGVHTLTFQGGGSVKALLYAKYSCRNR